MRKVLEWGIASVIFLSAVAYIPGNSFADVQLNVLRIAVPLLFLFALMMKPVRNVKSLFLPLIGILCFVNTVLLKANLAPLVHVLLGIILFYLITNYVEDWKPIYWGLGGVIVLNTIIVLLQAVGADPVCFTEEGKRNTHFVGLFGFKYVMGAWMAIVTPFLLFSKRWFLGMISAILTVLSFSFASITLMTLAIIYCMGRLKGWKIAVGLVLVALLVGYGSYTYTLNKPAYKGNKILTMSYKIGTRWHLESELLKPLFAKPLTGFGLSSFQVIGPQIFNSKTDIYGTMTDAWNEWLERGIELGFPIIGLFIAYAICIFRKFGSRKDYGLQGSLAIIPFGMLFHTYFIHTSICILVIMLLAMWEAS